LSPLLLPSVGGPVGNRKKIARKLGNTGYSILGAESFFVQSTGGPLVDGERERAVAWRRALAARLEVDRRRVVGVS